MEVIVVPVHELEVCDAYRYHRDTWITKAKQSLNSCCFDVAIDCIMHAKQIDKKLEKWNAGERD